MALQPYAFPLSNRLSDATLCFAKSCLQSPVCKVGCLCRPFSFLDVFTVGWSD